MTLHAISTVSGRYSLSVKSNLGDNKVDIRIYVYLQPSLYKRSHGGMCSVSPSAFRAKSRVICENKECKVLVKKRIENKHGDATKQLPSGGESQLWKSMLGKQMLPERDNV